MASVDFEQSIEVKEVAEDLIDRYFPHLKDAKEVIGYYFRDGDSDWAGKCKKCTAFERHLTNRTYFIFINRGAWERLSEPVRRALVDHELCHIVREKEEQIDPETKQVKFDWADKKNPANWKIRDHDVEEFSDVIKRHGLWEQGIESFAIAVRKVDFQITLDDVDRDDNLLRVAK